MKIGLGLIVRNEEKDLPACLASFIPAVDGICVIDTGSTDRTMECAKDILSSAGLTYCVDSYLDASDDQGRIIDFSKARNEYIKRLEHLDFDYLMSADADDLLMTPDIRGLIAADPADYYSIHYYMSETYWFQSYKIWRTETKTRYQGRVHECINIDWKRKIRDVPVNVKHVFTQYDNQEGGTERNLRILRSEIYPPMRSLFYYANENVDSHNYQEAIKWYCEYIRRANEGESCWYVELAHCYFRAARWLNHVGLTKRAVELCKELLAKDPSWSEAWCELAHIERKRGNKKLMKEYCLKALGNKYTHRLFSEQDKYTTTPISMLAEEKML